MVLRMGKRDPITSSWEFVNESISLDQYSKLHGVRKDDKEEKKAKWTDEEILHFKENPQLLNQLLRKLPKHFRAKILIQVHGLTKKEAGKQISAGDSFVDDIVKKKDRLFNYKQLAELAIVLDVPLHALMDNSTIPDPTFVEYLVASRHRICVSDLASSISFQVGKKEIYGLWLRNENILPYENANIAVRVRTQQDYFSVAFHIQFPSQLTHESIRKLREKLNHQVMYVTLHSSLLRESWQLNFFGSSGGGIEPMTVQVRELLRLPSAQLLWPLPNLK